MAIVAQVLATFLVWLQETKSPVFTVATANEVQNLPPELLRAGRFDNRFFLGCPGSESRERIFEIHLEKREHDSNDFDLRALAAATPGFTGAEIEQVVLDAMYSSFSEKENLTSRLAEETAKGMKPLIATMGAQMETIWDMVEKGRIETASADILSKHEIKRIVDPYRYFPMYCRLSAISGYQAEAERAERLGSARLEYGPSICILSVDDPDWIYGQCNFKIAQGDEGSFKFLDQFETVEENDVLFKLAADQGVETILFDSEDVMKKFEGSDILVSLSDMFVIVNPYETT